jgi:hypothetical protein
MITCDDTDLFGGRISVVSAPAFCCQVETAGERLRLIPATVIRDLLPADPADHERAVIVLIHRAIQPDLLASVNHHLIVTYLETAAARNNRLTLRQALESAAHRLRHLGNWKWLTDSDSSSPADATSKLASTEVPWLPEPPPRSNTVIAQ